MITDQDIEKLKGTFATKDDLAVFVTKEDHNSLADKVDGIQEQLGDLKVEVGEMHDEIRSLGVKFDDMLGLLTGSMQEHAAGAAHLARHDRQIASLVVVT